MAGMNMKFTDNLLSYSRLSDRRWFFMVRERTKIAFECGRF